MLIYCVYAYSFNANISFCCAVNQDIKKKFTCCFKKISIRYNEKRNDNDKHLNPKLTL